jgi:hypothetical protein
MLLLLLGRCDDLTAVVVAAVRTNAVRQHRFVALAAILNAKGPQVLVTAALALAGV